MVASVPTSSRLASPRYVVVGSSKLGPVVPVRRSVYNSRPFSSVAFTLLSIHIHDTFQAKARARASCAYALLRFKFYILLASLSARLFAHIRNTRSP